MFFKLYRTRIKCLLKDKENIFWSFGFPIILSLFFYMAFNNIGSSENLDTIPIAVIQNQSMDKEAVEVLESLKIDENKRMFQIQTVNLNTAKDLLKNDKIKAYVELSTDTTFYIKENGFEQTILKSVLDSYLQKKQMVNNIVSTNPDAINKGLIQEVSKNINYVKDGEKNEKSPDYTIIYFYTLIALSCMFGCNWGFNEIVNIQADQSSIGARINVAPIRKIKLLFSNLFAAFSLHYLSVLFLIGFLKFILKIKFGDNLGIVLLTSVIGSLCGISFGAFISVIVKTNLKVREAILTAFTIGSGFLAGMIVADMKYIIATKAPVIGYLNPASLITDIFYSLYYDDGYSRITINLCMLMLLTIIFWCITYIKIRRKEYASI